MHFCANLQFVNDRLYSNPQSTAMEKEGAILKEKLSLVNKGEQSKIGKAFWGKN